VDTRVHEMSEGQSCRSVIEHFTCTRSISNPRRK